MMTLPFKLPDARISATMLSRTESSLIYLKLVPTSRRSSLLCLHTDEKMRSDLEMTSAMVAQGVPPSSTKVTPRDKVRLVKFSAGAPLDARCFCKFLAMLRPIAPSPDLSVSLYSILTWCF